jgi:hypothetical protein
MGDSRHSFASASSVNERASTAVGDIPSSENSSGVSLSASGDPSSTADKNHNIDEESTETTHGSSQGTDEITVEVHNLMKDKQHYCYFCHKRRTHIDRHWMSQHMEEKEVIDLHF